MSAMEFGPESSIGYANALAAVTYTDLLVTSVLASGKALW